MEVYQDLSQQKHFAVRYRSRVKLRQVQRNQIMNKIVREEENKISNKLRKREEEKRKRNELHYSMRIQDHARISNQINDEISAMEQEEKEILERLKNSQRLEMDAYKDLENAIKSSVDSTEQRKRLMLEKNRVPIHKVPRSPKTVKAKSTSGSVYNQKLH